MHFAVLARCCGDRFRCAALRAEATCSDGRCCTKHIRIDRLWFSVAVATWSQRQNANYFAPARSSNHLRKELHIAQRAAGAPHERRTRSDPIIWLSSGPKLCAPLALLESPMHILRTRLPRY
mmetsp:Transcript_112129/g.182793  ORF Transcript_112129/g.182793 Transcript_112129/m.182793 type:complete len:122 (-) Transcript_112129:746-1111(-)